MKKLLFAAILSTNLFANGWMEMGVSAFLETESVAPVVSVGLSEPLPLLGLTYESWNGVGVNCRQNVWATSKHDLVVNVEQGVDVSAGIALRHNDVNYTDVHVMLKAALWE